MIKKGQEDYLRAMYELEEAGADQKEGIKKSEVACILDVSKSSVTQMMSKLYNDKMIKMDLYSRIFFTSKGRRLAEQITRKHRIIEVFLRDVLGYQSLKKINDEAHLLEHCFSDESIKRLNNYLGKPEKCPHGDVINH